MLLFWTPEWTPKGQDFSRKRFVFVGFQCIRAREARPEENKETRNPAREACPKNQLIN